MAGIALDIDHFSIGTAHNHAAANSTVGADGDRFFSPGILGRLDAGADSGKVPAVAMTVEAAPPSFKSRLRDSFITHSPFSNEFAGYVSAGSGTKQPSIKRHA